MGNPFVHAAVLIAAVIIPGGLIAYFAWRACARNKRSTPDEARAAFLAMYPPDSLRARSRRNHLDRVKAFRRRRRRKDSDK